MQPLLMSQVVNLDFLQTEYCNINVSGNVHPSLIGSFCDFVRGSSTGVTSNGKINDILHLLATAHVTCPDRRSGACISEEQLY